MGNARKNIDDITRTLTSLTGNERFVGRDGTGDFNILADVLAQLTVSDLPVGGILPFNGINVPS
ncbi:MAG: hypothetical protein U9N54_03475, partial [candidate division Zixibacteria bacterium]|nr:hypothetical protein [candidate division Zixibacteria bacterium]